MLNCSRFCPFYVCLLVLLANIFFNHKDDSLVRLGVLTNPGSLSDIRKHPAGELKLLCYEIAEVWAVYLTGLTQFITEEHANNGVSDSHKTNYIMISLIFLLIMIELLVITHEFDEFYIPREDGLLISLLASCEVRIQIKRDRKRQVSLRSDWFARTMNQSIKQMRMTWWP